jgi:hypothetical protein
MEFPLVDAANILGLWKDLAARIVREKESW